MVVGVYQHAWFIHDANTGWRLGLAHAIGHYCTDYLGLVSLSSFGKFKHPQIKKESNNNEKNPECWS